MPPSAVEAGSSSTRYRNAGATRIRASACWMPVSKSALCGPVDRSSLTSRLRILNGPAKGSARERPDDLPRAGKLVVGVSGLADEDSLAARRVPRPGWAERPGDHDRVDAATWRERTVYPEIRIRIVDASPPLTVNQSGANECAGRQ